MATNGKPTRKEVEQWRRRSDSHAQASINMENLAKAAGRECQRLEGELKRMSNELLAAQNSLMVLSEDATTRYDAANRAAQEYRERLIANGIDPDQ
jgi:hypothetical protein